MQVEVTKFEAHVTIEPVFEERFDMFEAICAEYNFKPAELLLQKTRKETPMRSNKDSFCTGHGADLEKLKARLLGLVNDLKGSGFSVWRYKIEGIVIDIHEPRLFNIDIPTEALCPTK